MNEKCYLHVHLNAYLFVVVAVQSLSHVQLLATPMDCSAPGSSVYGISPARILKWVAISRRSSDPGSEPSLLLSRHLGSLISLYLFINAYINIQIYT